MAQNYLNDCFGGKARRSGFVACIILPALIMAVFYAGLSSHMEIIKVMPESRSFNVTMMDVVPGAKPMAAPASMPPLAQEQPRPRPVVRPRPAPVAKPIIRQAMPASQAEQTASSVSSGGVNAQAGQPAPSLPAQMSATDYNLFVKAFLQSVQKRLYYPRNAQRAGIYGTVKVSIRFSAEGSIISYQLVSGDYHTTLGEAAITTIDNVKAVWKPPLAPGNAQTIIVPIVFSLK